MDVEAIVVKVHRLNVAAPLRNISDALLLALLANSDCTDIVNAGTILFERDEEIANWYLLLSGEVEIYVMCGDSVTGHRFPKCYSPNVNHPKVGRNVVRLQTLGAGALFGELGLTRHSCSARVSLITEFVRISQKHFLSLYNKHADHLQPYITVLEDLVAENASIIEKLRMQNSSPSLSQSLEMGNQNAKLLNGSPQSGRDHNREHLHSNHKIISGKKGKNEARYPASTSQQTFDNGIDMWPNEVQARFNPAQTLPPVSANLFEINSSVPLEMRICEAALLLKRTMQLRSPWLICDHRAQSPMGSYELYPQSMLGSEMSRWLGELCLEIFSNIAHTCAESPCEDSCEQSKNDASFFVAMTEGKRGRKFREFSPLQLAGIWQALLDANHVRQVNFERHFKDKPNILYQWTVNDPYDAFYQARANFYFNLMEPKLRSASSAAAYATHLGWGAAASALFNGRLLPPLSNVISAATNFDALLLCGTTAMLASDGGLFHDDSSDDTEDVTNSGESLPNLYDLQSAIFVLNAVGLDSLLKVILCKLPEERTISELELVYDELLNIKAFSHLSSMVKRELARVIRFEQYAHPGTVLFRQGEQGDSWFIIWRCGSVDVSILGKGVVCVLHEGDDFGKLALVNDAPRAATVTLRDANSQFLRVEKHDFNRILRDVEANTVRLKEHGQDVLVLERVSAMSCLPLSPHNPCTASTFAGPPPVPILPPPTSGRHSPRRRSQCCYSMMAGVPEKMMEYLLETRIDPVSIYAIPFTNRIAEESECINGRQRNHRNVSPYEIFAGTDALTKSCCIDYSDLPLRYVDDETIAAKNDVYACSSAAGYVSDGNMNYCNVMSPNANAVNSIPRRRKSVLHSRQNDVMVDDVLAAEHLTSSSSKRPPFFFAVENMDTSLEDFILTHIIFMPSNALCNFLKTYYNRKRQFLPYSYKGASALPLPPQMTPQNTRARFSPSMELGALTGTDLEDLHEQFVAKRRVVAFLVIWQHVLGVQFFLDPVANSFVEEIYCSVLEDLQFIPNMAQIAEQIGQLRQLREYAMTLLTRHPAVILDCGVYSAQAPAPEPVLPTDICNQCIYLADTTFITMNVRLDKSTTEIATMAREKIRRQRRALPQTHKKITMPISEFEQQHLQHNSQNGFSNIAFPINDTDGSGLPITTTAKDSPEEVSDESFGTDAADEEPCFLVEVKSNGERVVFSPTEVSVSTMLTLNGRLYVIFAEEIDSIVPLPSQDGPTQSVNHSILELLRSREIAQQLAVFHTQLFNATDEIELIFQMIGRDQFPGRNSANLDLLLRRFNEVQYWTSTEVLLAPTATKRFNILRKFIKIASHSKQMGDLMAVFAITLGLSNVAVSRLSHLWMKLPTKLRRIYAEFEALLDPSRNHRAYRLLIAKLNAPIVPFVPLLLKDLTFMHEGNKTSFAGLVNFEKMHMIANVLRSFRNCKASRYHFGVHPPLKKKGYHGLIRNFRVIDNQRRLMELSYKIEPATTNRHQISNMLLQQQQQQHFRQRLQRHMVQPFHGNIADPSHINNREISQNLAELSISPIGVTNENDDVREHNIK